jgi:hypothetical protein
MFLISGNGTVYALSIERGAQLGATGQSTGCAGDEQMSFAPGYPLTGQQVTVTVTSARPSVNVALAGPFAPQFLGAQPGGKGTNWFYRFVPTQPGQFNYNFYVGPTICTANVVSVSGPSTPVPPPPPPNTWQFSAPSPQSIQQGYISIGAYNTASVRFSIIVAGPLGPSGGPAHAQNFNTIPGQWLYVRYPQDFPQGSPLQVGNYHIEWTDLYGNDYSDTIVAVTP